MSPDAAPSPLYPVVAGWRAALENLSPHASPCRNLPPTKWAAIRESALTFCDQFGGEAHRLGWTAPELFAVHPEHGTIRLDACGVLMINGVAARGVEATCIISGADLGLPERAGEGLGRAGLGICQER